ncbi:MAG: ATP-binding protein [Clostridia bacterium]|nr:ATP-binding protein [Clostridia bacterium]
MSMRLEDIIVSTNLEDAKISDRIFLPSTNEIAQSILFDIKTVGLAEIGFKNNPQGFEKNGSFWTRDRAAFETDKINYYDVNYGLRSAFYDDINIGLRPCMNLDINAYLDLQEAMKKRHDDERYAFYRDPEDKEHDYILLDFGEYPQVVVNGDRNFENEKDRLVKTNRKYLLAFDKIIGQPVLCSERELDGQKYVKVATNNRIYYLANKPLAWIVTNWHELPREINAQGNGKAQTIKLITRNVINFGIPFYRTSNFDPAKFKFKNNKTLWQNSTLRGYLNGYDLSMLNAGNFTEHNFIDEAFTKEKELLQTIECQNKINRKGWGVNLSQQSLNETEQLRKYIEHGHPVMLHGPSGIGKSRRVQEIDPNYVSLTLRNGMLPEEIIGKNIFINEKDVKSAQWQAPAWYTDLCEKCAKEPHKRHILFIDELTNVREQEQSAVFHIVLDRSVTPNCGKLPDNVSIVAAGNSMEKSTAAYQIAEPLERRFYGHIYFEPNIMDWLDWANRMNEDKGHLNVHPLVTAFVASMRDAVFCPQPDPDDTKKYNYKIDPRAWEQVSDLIYDNGGMIYKEIIANKIGPLLTNALVAFAKNPPLTAEDIVNKNYSQIEIPRKFDQQYILAMAWRYAKPEQVPVIREFISREFGEEILSVYDGARALVVKNIKSELEK